MNIYGFHHVAVPAADVEACAAFYREVLGLTEKARHLRADGSLRGVWLSIGPGEGEGGFLAVEARPEVPRLGPSMVAFRIGQRERASVVETLQRRGVKVVHQTRWTVYVEDPAGNRVGLSHYPADPLPG
ncbi:MAG: VOC family protein [Myxococcota bacterium]